MSLNDILATATSGLAAAQAGLRTVSTNIANVGVVGYARERVSLTTATSGGQSTGVVVGEPTRIADQYLENTVYTRAGAYGQANVTSTYLDRLQALLGQPGSTTGLSASLDAISSAAIAMTGSQDTTQTGAVFSGDVQDALSQMQQLSSDVDGLQGDVESEVSSSVDQINGLLKQIYSLNDTIAQATALGQSSGGAEDQRMSALQQLSGLMSTTVREQPDGRVTIESATGQVLLDRRLRQLSYPTDGSGTSQPTYPPIEIRFANPDASTGDTIDSAAIGGSLGGLIDLRDRALPQFNSQLGTLFNGLAQSLNSVSNTSTTYPAPSSMTGHQTGMIGSDRLGFTGSAVFAVTGSDGTVIAKTNVDFDALGPSATVDDMVNAINTGLGGAGTASFTDGKLTIQAAGSGNGVVIAQDPTDPSSRGGVGVSQFFGMNDLVTSSTSPLVPSGFNASDPSGFDTGQTAQFVLRDSAGRTLANYTLSPTTGDTMGDLLGDLNGSSLSGYGSFALDANGQVQFTPNSATTGAVLSVPTDSTDRYGTGASFSSLMGLSASSGMDGATVNSKMLSSSSALPLAQFDTTAAVGAKAISPGDTRGATAVINQLASRITFGDGTTNTLDGFSAELLGNTGLAASQAESNLTNASSRMDDAVNRRDSFSGVNIDEELSLMVTLQSSYSAAARVLTTTQTMYDTLIDMVR